jgi:hypothetical protein
MAWEPSPPAIASPSAAGGDRVAYEPLEVPGGTELDRLDPARSGFGGQRESLGLAAAGLRVEEQHRPPWCRHTRQRRTDAEGGSRAGAAAHERAGDEQLLEQAIADQQEDPRAEAEHSAGQARHARHSPAQDAIPGGAGAEDDARERDQAAREFLHRDDDREAEPAEAERQGADRRRLPSAHRIAPA